MIGRLTALIFLSTVSQIQTLKLPQQLPSTVVQLGDSLTLSCAILGDQDALFYWYKLKCGYMLQTVGAGTFGKISLEGQFNNSRFTLKKESTQCLLNIKNVSKEDEATYFCQAGSAYTMKFLNGIFLSVDDHKNQQKSNQQKSFYVKQSSEIESVQPGDSVSLQCSLLSKNKENNDDCAGEHRHASDAGNYYCAVVACGEIMFGEGTKAQTRQQWDPVVIILGSLLALCVIVITILICSRN
ncbi:uncharacterized protein LOC131981370 [Centropristis striata]|uniref:uncharacterized protein LOC131981370 n=1 Tax=Centropristis striata TaxID=184440 RepID=UPI0027E12601|nr:uncharacterized protein LOC131981370 [Centropristis striata]